MASQYKSEKVVKFGKDRNPKETYHLIWSKSGARSEYKVEFHTAGNTSRLDKNLYANQLSYVRPGWIAEFRSRSDGRPKKVLFKDELGYKYFSYNFNYTFEKSNDKISLVGNSSNIKLEIEFSKTQLEILYAAEIVMGQKGIENTSHRDIINLAGQKNTSAILYHFGSIEGVVNALFELRMKVQNQERSELLEIILNQEDYSNMDLMDAYIDPMYNKVFYDSDWSNWIYFLQNLIISTNGKKYYADKYRKAAAEIEELFAKKNHIENDKMYSARVSYNAFFFISAIASRKKQIEETENQFEQNSKKFNSLLDMPLDKENYISSDAEFLRFLKTTSIFILTNKESKF